MHLSLGRFLFFGVCLAGPLVAQDEPLSVEARLARLEAALARIEARLNDKVTRDEVSPMIREVGELSQKIAARDRDVPAVRVVGREEKLAIGGLVQLTGEAGEAPDARFEGINNRFLIRRARLLLRGSFAEQVDFTFQPEFGNAAIAGNAANRAQLTDFFVTWKKYPLATLQVGQFKTPFGYEQLVGDSRVVTVERSLPNDRLTFGRQIGVGVSGAGDGDRFTYSAGLFNGNGTNNGGNDNDQPMSAGRVTARVWGGASASLRVGANLLHTRDTGAFTGTRDARGLDLQFTGGGFDFAAEYLRVDSRRRPGAKTEADGAMAQATWFFVPKIWQAVARFETFDANRQLANDTSRAWVLGFNYCLKGDDLKLSLNYHLGNPAGPSDHDARLLGRVQVVF